MTAPLPSPEDVAAMREAHAVTYVHPDDETATVICAHCDEPSPCDAGRLLTLVDSLTHLVRLADKRRDRAEACLDAVLAECDRSEEACDYGAAEDPECEAVVRALTSRIRRAGAGEGSHKLAVPLSNSELAPLHDRRDSAFPAERDGFDHHNAEA